MLELKASSNGIRARPQPQPAPSRSAVPPDVRWWLCPTGRRAFFDLGLCPRMAWGAAPKKMRNRLAVGH